MTAAAGIHLRSGHLREVPAQARCAPVRIAIAYPRARATAAVKTCVEWVITVARRDPPA